MRVGRIQHHQPSGSRLRILCFVAFVTVLAAFGGAALMFATVGGTGLGHDRQRFDEQP